MGENDGTWACWPEEMKIAESATGQTLWVHFWVASTP